MNEWEKEAQVMDKERYHVVRKVRVKTDGNVENLTKLIR